jgi:phage regulator Rha-like protein
MKPRPRVKDIVAVERVESLIHTVRGQKVMLDSDLAALYAVEVRALIQAVKRNIERFPEDFMLQLTREESRALRSQSVTLKPGRGQHRKYLPYAFTQEGVAMLSSVLRSPRAILVNIEIMRAFVRLRRLMATHADLRRKIKELERKYDKQFAVVFEAIREILDPSRERTKGRIGFRPKADPGAKP